MCCYIFSPRSLCLHLQLAVRGRPGDTAAPGGTLSLLAGDTAAPGGTLSLLAGGTATPGGTLSLLAGVTAAPGGTLSLLAGLVACQGTFGAAFRSSVETIMWYSNNP